MLQDEINRLKRDLENSKREAPKQVVPKGRAKSKSPPRLKDKQPIINLLEKLSEATHKS